MDFEEFEEGEVQSDDNDEDPNRPPPAPKNSLEFPDFPEDPDYEILERPGRRSYAALFSQTPATVKVVPPSMNPPRDCINTSFPSTSTPQVQKPATATKSCYKDLGLSDSDNERNSPSDNDSDDDTSFGKRQRMTSSVPSFATFGGFPGNSLSTAAPSSANSDANTEFLRAFQVEASKFQKQRKVNNIWSNFEQEEQMSKIFELGVEVEDKRETHIEVERGPETYYYQLPKREPRERYESESSDISSEGLTDNELQYLRGEAKGDSDATTGAEAVDFTEDSLPKSFTSKSTSKMASTSRKRPKQSSRNQKYKQKVLKRLKKLKAPELAKKIALKLQEQKISLVERAVEILGKDVCIRTFIKTLKIQKRGGLLIKNQTRQRTAGGTFFYLIRGDARNSKRDIDRVFSGDKLWNEKARQKRQAVSRLQKKATLEKQAGATSELADAERCNAFDNEDSKSGFDEDEIPSNQLDMSLTTQHAGVSAQGGDDDFLEMNCDIDM